MLLPTIEDLIDRLEQAVDDAEASDAQISLPLQARIQALHTRVSSLSQKCVRLSMNATTLVDDNDDPPCEATDDDGESDDDGAIIARTYAELFHSRTSSGFAERGLLGWLSRGFGTAKEQSPRRSMDGDSPHTASRASDDTSIRSVDGLMRSLSSAATLKRIAARHRQQHFDEIESYYGARPELALYTLNCELTRMEYVVITEAGVELKDAITIRKYYHSEGETACCHGCELLWRMANQSVFAYLLAPVQECWMVPDIASTISVGKCQLTLDLRRKCLQCTCVLIVACDCDDQRTEVATCAGEIRVDLDRRKFAPSLESPRLISQDDDGPRYSGEKEVGSSGSSHREHVAAMAQPDEPVE